MKRLFWGAHFLSFVLQQDSFGGIYLSIINPNVALFGEIRKSLLQEGKGENVGCSFHLLTCSIRSTLELMITEGNKQKGRVLVTLPSMSERVIPIVADVYG